MNDAPSGNIDNFRTILSEAVWRFHAYDANGRDPKKAIRALKKKAAGYPAEFYQQSELNFSLLIATIES